MSDLNELEPLKEALAPGPDALAEVRQRARVLAAFEARRRSAWRPWALAAATGLVAIGVVAAVSLRPARPAVTFADAQPVPLGAPLVVPVASTPLVLAFADSSRVTIAPGSEAQVDAADAARVDVRVTRGRVEAHVQKGTGRAWRYLAGDYAVRVTGTTLAVEWTPGARGLEVSVSEGAVEVTGPGLSPPVTVRAGQRWHASERAADVDVDVDVDVERSPNPASAGAPDPDAAGKTGRADEPGAEVGAPEPADPLSAGLDLSEGSRGAGSANPVSPSGVEGPRDARIESVDVRSSAVPGRSGDGVVDRPQAGSPRALDSARAERRSPELNAETGTAGVPGAEVATAAAAQRSTSGRDVLARPEPIVIATDRELASQVRSAPASETGGAWRALVTTGHAAEGLAAAKASGALARLDALSDTDALLIADAARLTHDPELARRALTAVANRTGPDSAEGAFLLGRLEAEQRHADAAASAFRRCLERAPKGEWAEEARGRLLETLLGTPDQEAAAAAAIDYLVHHPDGAWSHTARATLDAKGRRTP